MYVIEWATVRQPEWSPIPFERYADREWAALVAAAWVKAAPPDMEFRVMPEKPEGSCDDAEP